MDTIDWTILQPIAYPNINEPDTMPARNSSTQDKSCSYQGVDYRLVVESRANARKLLGIIGACRFVWNNILNQCQENYQQAKEAGERTPSVSFFTLGKAFTKLRTSTPWLQDYSFTLVRYSLKRQADAWKKILS